MGRPVSLVVILLIIVLISFSDHASLQASLPVSSINGGPLTNVTFAQDHLQKNASQNNTKSNYTANNSIVGANIGHLALNVIPANRSQTVGILGGPSVSGGSLTTLFNSDTLRTSDVEDINIDFPYLTDNAYQPFHNIFPNAHKTRFYSLDFNLVSFIIISYWSKGHYVHIGPYIVCK